MSAFLGWRDAGQVLISKNEGLRLENEQRDMAEHGPRQDSAMAVMSRRKRRTQHVDEERMRDKEAAAEFPTDLVEVLSRKPESRIKWLHKGMVLVGKKVVPVTTIYNIATNKKFVAAVTDSQGSRMKAMLLANLHLFSAKQQKYLQSEASNFYEFETTSSTGASGRPERSEPRRRRSPQSRSPKVSARSRSPKASRRKQREEASRSSPELPPPKKRRKDRDRSIEAPRSSPEAAPAKSRGKTRHRSRSRSRRRSCSNSCSQSSHCKRSARRSERAERGADKRRSTTEGSGSGRETSPAAKSGGIVAAWLQKQRLPDPAPLPKEAKLPEPDSDDDPRVSMPGAADAFL